MGVFEAAQLWALASEAVLALTHLKVLFCVGKPLSQQTLSSKRWTYFLWDLVSPWLGLTLALAPGMAATAQQSIIQAACQGPTWANSTPAGRHVCTAAEPNMWAIALSCLRLLPAPEAAAALGHAAAAAGAAALATVSVSPLLAALVLLLLGHAALHVYYIATWSQRHARRVVQMSACEDVKQRLSAFGRLEVLWFHIGTGYDILSHLLLGAVLAKAALGGGIALDGNGAASMQQYLHETRSTISSMASALLPLQ